MGPAGAGCPCERRGGAPVRTPVHNLEPSLGFIAVRHDAEFQLGLRAFPRADAVQLDPSYGGFLRTGRRAAG